MPVDDDLLGQRVANRYRVVERIGQGGMATVYRAHDEQLGRQVALKVFHRGLTSPEDLERQQAEIRHLAGLTHRSLVTLYDAISDEDGRSLLVLEYVDGHDLRARLAGGALSPAVVAHIGRDIADALAYLHQGGLIHRDVSPGNVLLSSEAATDRGIAAKLTDLGIARVVDSGRITVTGTLIGTAAYLSPEQVRGDSTGPASDIYSLGLLLLECLTGQRAFEGPAMEAAVARLSRDPEIPDDIPAEWRSLIAAMTARDPGGRPTAIESAERLAIITAPAAPLDETRPMAAPSDPTVTRVLEQPGPDTSETVLLRQPRRPSLAVVLGAGAAILVVLIVVLALPGSSKAPQKPPAYPVVPGQLGTHLKQLEQHVSPSSQ